MTADLFIFDLLTNDVQREEMVEPFADHVFLIKHQHI